MVSAVEVIAGLVLAGGQSRRMGQHKALVEVGGVPLVARACGRLRDICAPIAVSVRESGPVADFVARLGIPAVFDLPASPASALNGVLAGLLWARSAGAELMLSIPCDVPFLPPDLPHKLIAAATDTSCAVARTFRGVEPLCAAWRTDLIDMLQAECGSESQSPLHAIVRRAQGIMVDFPDPEAFLNVNTPQDVALAEAMVHGHHT
jgi:molybdopterin-guanine dinucleotide biosynthesis protein A